METHFTVYDLKPEHKTDNPNYRTSEVHREPASFKLKPTYFIECDTGNLL